MTSTAVIQVKPGIGDVIWHLPFIRAIAAISPGGIVTFLAPPSSGAKELLAGEPCVSETFYFEHFGSEFRRGINLIRLILLLRRYRFRTLWILDRTIRPALAAKLAGIPNRIGLGLGPQRWFITNSGIGEEHFHDHPIGWLTALLGATNVPLPTTEPCLHVCNSLYVAIGERFRGLRRPWIVIGIGASDPRRDWPDDYWVHFLSGLRNLTLGTVFLIGGGQNEARAQAMLTRSAAALSINACGMRLGEVLALLRHADLFFGTDSGPMNLAVAVGTPAFVLFGVNPALGYSKYIHAIEPPGGQTSEGMRRISPAQALARVALYLSQEKEGGNRAHPSSSQGCGQLLS